MNDRRILGVKKRHTLKGSASVTIGCYLGHSHCYGFDASPCHFRTLDECSQVTFGCVLDYHTTRHIDASTKAHGQVGMLDCPIQVSVLIQKRTYLTKPTSFLNRVKSFSSIRVLWLTRISWS